MKSPVWQLINSLIDLVGSITDLLTALANNAPALFA